MALGVGDLLAGRYEIVAPIAVGGMGEVWQARDRSLDRIVAAKVLKNEFVDDPSFLARFRNEARHTAALSHPNIASVYDYGESAEDGQSLAYLVMEYVEGQPLITVLHEAGRLSPERTLDVLGQAAAGLSAAHAAGVVHRDIKPGNLIVRPDGMVKLTDFGIAWARGAVPLTRTGMVVGTAQYLSPEQAQGHQVTAASDIYALGVLGYECLAGRRPFDGASQVAIVLAQIDRPPPPLPADVPGPVRQLIERAMAKDPADRFPDGAAFGAAVAQVAGGGSVTPAAGTAVLGGGGSGGGPNQTMIFPAGAAGLAGAAGAGAAAAGAGVAGAGTRPTAVGRPMPPLHGPPVNETRAFARPVPAGAPPAPYRSAPDQPAPYQPPPHQPPRQPPHQPPHQPPSRVRRRVPWFWLAAAVALLVLLGGALILSTTGDDSDTATPTGSSAPAPTTTAAPTTTQAPAEVFFIDTSAYVGEDADDVAGLLSEAGLNVDQQTASQAQLEEVGAKADRNTVVTTDPRETTVELGSTVVLYVAADDFNPGGNNNGGQATTSPVPTTVPPVDPPAGPPADQGDGG